MTKVIIDSFDTQEQAVAFVDWLKRKFDKGMCRLITTQGIYLPYWDGIDQAQTDSTQITMNIVVDTEDQDEGF